MILSKIVNDEHNIKCSINGCENVAAWLIRNTVQSLRCDYHKHAMIFQSIQDNTMITYGNNVILSVINVEDETEDNGNNTD